VTRALPRLEPLRYARTGTLEVAYYEAGPSDGDVTLLLHGFPYDIHSYTEVIPLLAETGRRVIVPYLRGHGATRFLDPAAPRAGQQAAIGTDVVDLMDALGIPRAILAGYDWGGRAACVTAALWPERRVGLVSVGSYLIQDIATAMTPVRPDLEAGFWYFYYFLTERGRAGLTANRREIARVIWARNSPAWHFDDATLERAAVAFGNPDYVEVVLHSYRHRRPGTGRPGHDRCHSTPDERNQAMSTIITKDGTEIYYKDWGSGPVVTFSHGWPLSADAWDGQMHFLAQNGFRVVGHDRRGHGRSSQTSTGNDMDGYADDLAAVIEALDLTDATLVGHSTGGGEVARYIGRHGTGRVAKAALVSAVPPVMLQSAANPEGLPMEVFDGLRAGLVKDRSQFYKDLATPFYGANRPGAQVSQGVLNQFWLWSMQSGLRNAYASIKAFSETDFTEDLKKFDVPTLVLHGEDDQIVPVKDAAVKSAQLIKGAQEIYYPGAPHGLMDTHADRFNADLLAFLRS
jgi:non-heme chloroperoxidase